VHSSKPIQEQPDFSTLTGIMTRFAEVPYAQFKQELNEWFQTSLSAKGIDFSHLINNGNEHLPALLDQLVSYIYAHAERANDQQNGGISDV
jgi:hypothetical protein